MISRCIYIIIIFNIIISQAQYQIIQLPNNTLELVSNNSISIIENFNTNKLSSSFSTTLINYPANINLFNVKINQFSLSILNYGILEDKFNNESLKTFTANEYYLQYLINKKLNNNISLYYSIGTIYSQIYNYNSIALTSSLKINKYFKKNNLSISFAINNVGVVLKKYSVANVNLPIEYQFAFGYYLKNIKMGYDVIYNYKDYNILHILSLKLNIIKNINIILSNTNSSKKLSNENHLNYLSGFSGGINFTINNTNINMGFLNLGPAGLATSMTINYKLF